MVAKQLCVRGLQPLQKALQGKVRRARGTRGEFWMCDACKRTNQCLSVTSYAEYLALSHNQCKDLLQCGMYAFAPSRAVAAVSADTASYVFP